MEPTQLSFTLDHDLWWTTSVIFPFWQVFKQGTDSRQDHEMQFPSEETIRIVFAPEGRDTAPLTESEIDSVHWVIKNEASAVQSMLSSLFAQYPSLQEQYGYSEEEKAECMPDIQSVNDLRHLITLNDVNVHPISKHGIPYFGFQMGCAWDAEHGLGVLMHGTRVVEIGGADTAILLWLAEEDAEQL